MIDSLMTDSHAVIAWLTLHLNAKSGTDLALLITNGLVATTIVALLAFPSTTPGERTRMNVRIGRYVLALIYVFLALRVWTGHYSTPVDPGELAVNVYMLKQVWATRGDMQLLADVYNELRRRRALRRGKL